MAGANSTVCASACATVDLTDACIAADVANYIGVEHEERIDKLKAAGIIQEEPEGAA